MPLIAFTLLKYLFLALLYVFLAIATVTISRDILLLSGTNKKSGRLVAVEGKLSGRSFWLSPTMSMGRGDQNNLVLDDEYCSSSHAMILQNSSGFLIQDMGSSNGTFVNGKVIEAAKKLRSGDVILVGKSSFRFELEKK